jgi:hypothetical protein
VEMHILNTSNRLMSPDKAMGYTKYTQKYMKRLEYVSRLYAVHLIFLRKHFSNPTVKGWISCALAQKEKGNIAKELKKVFIDFPKFGLKYCLMVPPVL